MKTIKTIIQELWEYLYNKNEFRGVAIISRERFEEEMRLLELRYQSFILDKKIEGHNCQEEGCQEYH